MNKILTFKQLEFSEIPEHVLVDTSVLVSAIYDHDIFHESVEELFKRLDSAKVKPYSNVIIKTEFLNIQRRIVIAESLVSLYRTHSKDLNLRMVGELKSLTTRMEKAIEDSRGFKLSEQEIKKYQFLFDESYPGENRWYKFCQNYLKDIISKTWAVLEDDFGLNFISTRQNDMHPLLTGPVEWSGAIKLMERFGLASGDAMILNLFFNSKIPTLVTCDAELAKIVVEFSSAQAKTVIVPN